jgi:hypothetical protein
VKRLLRAVPSLLLCTACVTYTTAGRNVKIEHAFHSSDYTLHPDPFASRCALVRSEENGAAGRRMFGPVEAGNYAATIGANSIYWREDDVDKVRGKLVKCSMVRNMNYGQFGLAASEIECRNDTGVTYRIPEFRGTLKFYACGGEVKPAP